VMVRQILSEFWEIIVVIKRWWVLSQFGISWMGVGSEAGGATELAEAFKVYDPIGPHDIHILCPHKGQWPSVVGIKFASPQLQQVHMSGSVHGFWR